MIRFRAAFEDAWTLAYAEGVDADSAINLLATALVRRGDEVQVWFDDDWQPIKESE